MRRPVFLIVLAILAMAGCLRLGPDYERPDTGLEPPERYLEAESRPTWRYTDYNQWWKEFEDPGLNRVIRRVMAKNPEIHQAAASVLEVRAQVGQARADRFPKIDLNGGASRQKRSIVEPWTGDIISVYNESFSLTLPASFELDLWGRLARASEAARADLLAAEKNRKTIVQSLIAEAVTRYFDIQSLKTQLAITRRMTAAYQENLKLVEARYASGLTSILDLRQARRSLAKSRAEIPGLVQALGQARQSLAVLQGSYPKTTADDSFRKPGFSLPPPIPPGLPAELLNRRPDIQAAESSLQAACARIGVAKANRFPRISLTGTAGYTSDELDMLFDTESELWGFGTELFHPLFDAGKRKAAQKAAEARYQQQLAAYAQTVLNAFSEVEGALLTREQQIKRHRRLTDYLEEAKATLNTARDRYQRGLSNYLNVLDARQAKFQAELTLTETRYTLYQNRVTLYRALGGGWGDAVKEASRK